MDLSGFTLNDLVKLYRHGQDTSAAIMADAKARAKQADAVAEAAKARILQIMDESRTTSLSCDQGRISVATIKQIGVQVGAGWDEFCRWVVTHEAWDMIQKRPASNAVKSWMEENGGMVPPGISVRQVKSLRVAKPKQTKEE